MMSHGQADRVRMVANPYLIGINIPGFTGDFSDPGGDLLGPQRDRGDHRGQGEGPMSPDTSRACILELSDPYDPVELGRFLDASTSDGELDEFWGVYNVPRNQRAL